jgi:hypothetical protein
MRLPPLSLATMYSLFIIMGWRSLIVGEKRQDRDVLVENQALCIETSTDTKQEGSASCCYDIYFLQTFHLLLNRILSRVEAQYVKSDSRVGAVVKPQHPNTAACCMQSPTARTAATPYITVHVEPHSSVGRTNHPNCPQQDQSRPQHVSAMARVKGCLSSARLTSSRNAHAMRLLMCPAVISSYASHFSSL